MRFLAGLFICLLSTVSVTGCGGDDDGPAAARLRVLHASPDAPNVDVFVDGGKVLSNVPYPTVSNYLNVSPGTHRITVNAAGTSTTVLDVSPNLGSGAAYTAIAANFVANIQMLLATDRITPAASGQASARVVHAAPDAGPVDIVINGQKALANVPFGAISDYLNLAPGNYIVQVNAAGTSTTAIQSVLAVSAGTNYSVFAIGSVKTAATNPLVLKVLTDG
ncbi:protein of unknown function [Cupriavidus sp. YR651]|uniref:DUF4397 domain-containing protein n=1 Tax=Cupriavidus sp. YR651 TaxID=1855315 RepID=UPI00088C38FB|nr:DUF4397 domain-containing protein [Cupriavidus sp. YR651]SDD55256.1 protein of unknown function [Cupriavidus sp. YR651]